MACSRSWTLQDTPSSAFTNKRSFSLRGGGGKIPFYSLAFEGLTSSLLPCQGFSENKLSPALVKWLLTENSCGCAISALSSLIDR